MEKWVIAAKRADFKGIAAKYHIDPVIARLIRNRDVVGDEAIEAYLFGGLESLHDPHRMRDMDLAAGILEEKIRQKRPIRIIGDYDIDGIMSTYILLTGLADLGAEVDMKIPDRIADGYGINENLVRRAHEDGRDTILTCDNGIAAAGQITLAKELGMTVVVTDHHEVPYEEQPDGSRNYVLPPADAVVNPKRPDCDYPFPGLCGAAVAFKLIQVMEERAGRLRQESWRFLEFVAMATVGDVMDLRGENRILVKEGLKRLHATRNPGLRALILARELEPGRVTAHDIGFIIGPCLNASGRLETAERSLRLLLSRDEEEAARLAGDLKALNDSRREMTRQGVAQAVRLVEESGLLSDRVLVVYLPDCHESLAGLIAGRLRERYCRPAYVLTRGEEAVKGSGRSIEAYSMYEELCKCREFLAKFGGHPMAAGLSLTDESVIPAFRRALNERCTLTDADLVEKVRIDVPMPISYISKDLIRQIGLLEPFAKGNPEPLFAEKGLRVLGCRIFGKNRNVVKFQAENAAGYRIDAVYFGDGDAFAAYLAEHPVMSLAYRPVIDSYRGRESLQIEVSHYQ